MSHLAWRSAVHAVLGMPICRWSASRHKVGLLTDCQTLVAQRFNVDAAAHGLEEGPQSLHSHAGEAVSLRWYYYAACVSPSISDFVS